MPDPSNTPIYFEGFLNLNNFWTVHPIEILFFWKHIIFCVDYEKRVRFFLRCREYESGIRRNRKNSFQVGYLTFESLFCKILWWKHCLQLELKILNDWRQEKVSLKSYDFFYLGSETGQIKGEGVLRSLRKIEIRITLRSMGSSNFNSQPHARPGTPSNRSSKSGDWYFWKTLWKPLSLRFLNTKS